MKKLLKLLGIVVVLLVALIVILSLSMGSIIEKSVNKIGPRVMGVPVAVEDVGFNVLSGNASMKNLTIGNPEGFKTAHAFKVGEFSIAMQVGSVLSDRIMIDKILIDGPEITYEMGLRGNNLRKLKEQLEKKSEAPPEDKPAAEEPVTEETKKPGKKVEITELVISGGRVNFSATALGGSQVPIPLPTIRLNDIGKEKDGASMVEVVEEILEAILKTATGVVTESGKLLGRGAKETGRIIGEGAKLGADAAQKGADAAAEIAGKGAEAAAELAGKGAELGGAAAEEAGKAATKGAEAAAGAAKKVGGLLGGGSRKLLERVKGEGAETEE